MLTEAAEDDLQWEDDVTWGPQAWAASCVPQGSLGTGTAACQHA